MLIRMSDKTNGTVIKVFSNCVLDNTKLSICYEIITEKKPASVRNSFTSGVGRTFSACMNNVFCYNMQL